MASGNVIKRFIRIILDTVSAKKAETQLAAGLGDAGRKGGANFVRELRAAFDKRMGDLKTQLARGLIDPKTFRAQADLAAKQFNVGILAGIEKARAAGTLTEKEYLKLARTLKRTGDEGVGTWDRIKAAIVRAGATLAVYFGVRAGIRFAFSSIREFLDSEKDWKSLEGTINATGVSFEGLEKRVRAAAAAFQDETVHSDEDYARSLQRLIAITGDVEGSIRNMTLVANIAARFFGGDLAAATDAVAKGMNTGVVLINRMKFSLEELAKRSMGGSIDATQTLAGKLQQLNNQWQEFKEQIGEVLVGGRNTIGVLDTLTVSVKAMAKWVTDNKQEIQRWVSEGINTAIAGMRTLTGLVRTFLQLQGKLSLTAGAEAFTPGKTKEAIEAQQASLERQRKEEQAKFDKIKAQISNLKAIARNTTGSNALDIFPGFSPKLVKLEEQLRESGDLLNQIADNARTAKGALDDLAAPPPGGGGGGGGGGGAGENAAAKARGAELARVERDIAVRRLMVEQGLTEVLAREAVRREGLLRPPVEHVTASVEELEAAWKRLAAVDDPLMLAAGLTEELVPALSQTESHLEQLHSATETVAAAQPSLAAQFSTPWTKALGLIRHEVEGQGSLFFELGQAWAEGGIGGLAKLAAWKVKENFAAAIEQLAKGLGMLALGNIGGSQVAFASAAQHNVAAIAWAALAKGASGAGGGKQGAAGVGGGAAAGVGRSASMEKAPPEVHIYIDPLNPSDPRAQQFVHRAAENARERYGQNANIIMHPRSS